MASQRALVFVGHAAYVSLLEQLGLPCISANDAPSSGAQLPAPAAAALAPADDDAASPLLRCPVRPQDRKQLAQTPPLQNKAPYDALVAGLRDAGRYLLHPAAISHSAANQPGLEAVAASRNSTVICKSPPLSLWVVQRACLHHYGSLAGWEEALREARAERRRRLVDAIAHEGFSAQPEQEVDGNALLRAYVLHGAVPHEVNEPWGHTDGFVDEDTSARIEVVLWAALVDPFLEGHANLKGCFVIAQQDVVAFGLSVMGQGYESYADDDEAEEEEYWASAADFCYERTAWGTWEGQAPMRKARQAALAGWVRARGGEAAALAVQPPQAIQQLIRTGFHIQERR